MLSVNRALMNRYVAAWRRGDFEAAMACYSDDVVLHLPGVARRYGTVRGPAAVVGTALTAFATLGEDADMVVEDMLFSRNGAVMLATERTWLDDEELSWSWSVYYRMVFGRIAEISVHIDDHPAFERFLAGRLRPASAQPQRSSTSPPRLQRLRA